ncbi:BadF/BadG/BcrA/BcrD ATPase family protein [Halobacillus sp. A5]|uniref:BadF/BadG/BcrA/BcrD ATPase family protein n=1 Tax=Halobacillus sp. A5 TaxID=2880263 RepID=UPI0020A6961C|nr:BadF/BadG/BcrA/BcrD ATPase family protein [Halobacillus sp. A5]MCP3028051.1 hypothetical protein [Halobacillus sp. A5]
MIIGIDAGGTTTKGALISGDRQVLAVFHSGFGNPLIDKEKATAHINEVLQACIQAADHPIVHVVIGMAGFSTVKDHFIIPEEWSRPFKLTIVNDAELALEAGIPEGDGILTIAGTGSIHIGKKTGKIYTSGGWGHLLGDEGGGYDIGKNAIRTVLKDLESLHSASEFSKSLLNHINCINASGVKAWFYAQDKTAIASLSKFVSDMEKEKNGTAAHILHSSCKSLVTQIKRLYHRMEMTTEAKLVMAGSILQTNDFCYTIIDEELQGMFKEVSRLNEPAYIGAYTIAGYK